MPEKLPAKPRFAWKKSLGALGPAGIAATDRFVLVADRDPADTSDMFRCLNAADGSERWTIRYLAPAKLDYGNAPRATPLVVREKVYLYGALGHLHCVELDSGKILWKKNLRVEFNAHDDNPWGLCSSPLMVDGMLIVNPGGKEASLVALAADTGKVVWQTPGEPAAFSSFIVGVFGGKRQIVGYDKTSLGGWDIATGRRLWQLIPPRKHDFNVPTPIEFEGRLIACSENNGTRIYEFNSDGTIIPKPVAEHADFAPEAHTPVVVGGRLFGVWTELYCLDLRSALKTLWRSDDKAFADYASVIGSADRILVTNQNGELLLVDAKADLCNVISRLRLFDDDSGVYAHPALVGDRLYVRNSTAIYCLDLAP